jgi:hypothetical protein
MFSAGPGDSGTGGGLVTGSSAVDDGAGIMDGGWTGDWGSWAAVARRIISTTVGMPTSPWQTSAQRPQPTQAMVSSRWMK